MSVSVDERSKKTYHSLFLLQIRRNQIVQEEECIGVDRNKNVIFEFRDETALN